VRLVTLTRERGERIADHDWGGMIIVGVGEVTSGRPILNAVEYFQNDLSSVHMPSLSPCNFS
jgi:hypothetical protein